MSLESTNNFSWISTQIDSIMTEAQNEISKAEPMQRRHNFQKGFDLPINIRIVIPLSLIERLKQLVVKQVNYNSDCFHDQDDILDPLIQKYAHIDECYNSIEDIKQDTRELFQFLQEQAQDQLLNPLTGLPKAMNLNNFINPLEDRYLQNISEHNYIQKIAFQIENGKPASILSQGTDDKNDGRLKIIRNQQVYIRGQANDQIVQPGGIVTAPKQNYKVQYDSKDLLGQDFSCYQELEKFIESQPYEQQDYKSGDLTSSHFLQVLQNAFTKKQQSGIQQREQSKKQPQDNDDKINDLDKLLSQAIKPGSSDQAKQQLQEDKDDLNLQIQKGSLSSIKMINSRNNIADIQLVRNQMDLARNDNWAEIDKTPIINFQKKVPQPALHFPFELDPFQKRAIM